MGAVGGLEATVQERAARNAVDPRTFRHLPALDGLRGLAVLGVLVFHGGHLRGGYLGVDAFFVLSGFLITSLLLVEADRTGRIGLRAFWARRFKRLLPALVVFVLGMAVYAAVLASASELGRIRSDALATLGYVANWNAIFRQHGYWELFSSPSPLEHTWSLAIEEQFYLVWPLVVAALVSVPR
jgi:peptidoglycan/LPS O-acetylase OafA/YrhL